MNCPYCSKIMEKGVIESPQEINWKHKRKLFGTKLCNPDAVVLSPASFFNGAAVTAFICEDCEKVIIDYKKDDN